MIESAGAPSEPRDHESIVQATEATELGVYGRLPIAPVRGRGCVVTDARGEDYLDLYGGHAVALTGHCHPTVVAAIREHAGELLFYSSAVYSRIRAEANEALLRHAPHEGSRVFHCVSGSEANEVAVKIARLGTGRPGVVSFHGSFHGRTLGSLACTSMETYRRTAGIALSDDYRQIAPNDIAAARAAIDDRTAAVLVEPIQSLGGARRMDDAFLRELAELCRERGAKLIFDEIQTGLGRTGTMFYGDGIGVKPDMITLAKGLASGIPAAAVLVEPGLAALAKPGDQGTTFGGGPIAMAAMAATIRTIESEDLVANARARGEQLREGCHALDGVLRVHGRGLLIGLELDRPAKVVQQALLTRKIITGGSVPADTLRLLPPLVLGAAEVERFLEALAEVLAETADRRFEAAGERG